MKKQIRLAFALLAVGAVFLAVQPGVAQAATKKVTVTVKYVNEKYGNKVSSKKYKLKVGQTKKLSYASFTGYNKKKGSFTIKAGKKNSTKTIKISPKKITFTARAVNSRTNEEAARKNYTAYVGEPYTIYTSIIGFEQKKESFRVPTKKMTRTIKIKPKKVNITIYHRDIEGSNLYANNGDYKTRKEIKDIYFGDTFTVSPLKGYSGYTATAKKVKITEPYSQYVYLDTYVPKKRMVNLSIKDSETKQVVGTRKIEVEFGTSNSLEFQFRYGNKVARIWYNYAFYSWDDFQENQVQEGYFKEG